MPHVDDSFPEEHIDAHDNLNVAEHAADRFVIYNNEIGAPNLDAHEVEPANDKQTREPGAENDAERQIRM